LPAEIILYDGLVSVYRTGVDVWVYVSGSLDENELLLVNVLNTFMDALEQVAKGSIDKRSLLENIDLVFLAIDELVDGGYVSAISYTFI